MKKQTSILLLLLTFLFVNVDNATAQQKHEYVDLGLPSGTLWATCNVGAANPWDYGDYFAWGETTTKSSYWWDNYTYCRDGDYNKLTKYCTESDYGYNGFTDNKRKLEKTDDAATANWGSDWCMPTIEQFQELTGKCSWTWTTLNDKKGYNVKGPNGNSIFLPAAGNMYYDVPSYLGSGGYYWSSSLGAYGPGSARRLLFGSSYIAPDDWYGRSFGQSVRPVRCRN